MKGKLYPALAFIIASVLLMISVDGFIGDNPPSEPPPWKDRSTSIHLDKKMDFQYNNEVPMVAFLSTEERRGISLGIDQIVINDSNGIHRVPPMALEWNIKFHPEDNSVSYKTSVKIVPDNGTDTFPFIRFTFKPNWKDGTGTIRYDVNLTGDLSSGSVTYVWRATIERADQLPPPYPYPPPDPNEEERKILTGRMMDDRVIFNDTQGKDIVNLVWDKKAILHSNDGVMIKDVEVKNEGEGDDVVFDLGMYLSSRTMAIETGGYLEFMSDFIETVIETSDEAVSYVMDHFYSFVIGSALLVVIILPVFFIFGRVVSRKERPLDPDYKHGKHFKGPTR